VSKDARRARKVTPLLSVRDVCVRIGSTPIVQDLSFDLAAGETLCVVGESGCGKTMSALSLTRLLPENAAISRGSILFEGRDLVPLPLTDIEDIRGDRIAMIFQEPMTSLNPVMRIGDQIAEVVIRHRGWSRRQAAEHARKMLALVRMPDPAGQAIAFPHQLSGGMRQRAMIAMALACEPKILIADEPTTALDVTIQKQILALLKDLQSRLGMGLLLITHDFGVVAETADRVLVMYAGRKVEEAAVADIFDNPLHPYTRQLMRSSPRFAGHAALLPEVPGTVPALWDLPSGCAFWPRCSQASEQCRVGRPGLETRPGAHQVACWNADVPVHVSVP
jgi:peptide/nickel transport system ATP-binding protein